MARSRYVHPPISVGGGEKALDVGPTQRATHPLAGIEPSGHDPLGHARCAPAAVLGEAEERPKALGVAPDRCAAVRPLGRLRFDGGVDIGDPHRLKPLAASDEPVEELPGAAKVAADRSFGMPPLGAHPFLEGAELDAVGVTVLLGLVEPTKEAQPARDPAHRALCRFP